MAQVKNVRAEGNIFDTSPILKRVSAVNKGGGRHKAQRIRKVCTQPCQLAWGYSFIQCLC